MTAKDVEKRRDAKRIKQQSAKGNLYQKKNPTYARDQMRKIRAENGRNDGIYAQMIDDQRKPLDVVSDNILITSDFHIPFHNLSLLEKLFSVAVEYSVTDISIAGDFWDCDNVSTFTPGVPMKPAFDQEINHVRNVLDLITAAFKGVYFCRGNHEKRWLNLNAGKLDIKKLFGLTEITRGYQVTGDDHIYITQGDEKWLHCHPRNFRITPLSVVRDLSAKFGCHVVGGHGHQFGQGWDRSGRFKVADGGGLFDVHSLDYHRDTTCHPEVRSGFYLLQDNHLIAFEPDHEGKVVLEDSKGGKK